MHLQSRTGSRVTRWVGFALAMALAASSDQLATAQQDTTTSAWNDQVIDDLLDRLDDPSFAIREQASDELRALHEAGKLSLIPGMAGVTDRALLEMFAGRDLSPEQDARILEVARQDFFGSERAGVGMQWQPAGIGAAGGGDSRGLAISMTVAGFPCHDLARLVVGDVVTNVCGQPLDSKSLQQRQRLGQNDIVRAQILSYDPGEVITMHVIPHEQAKDPRAQPVERQIPLGQFSRLNNARPADDQTLELAWRIRLERFGFRRPGERTRSVLPTKVSAQNWSDHAERPFDEGPRSLIIGHADQNRLDDPWLEARVNAQVIQRADAQGFGRLLNQQLKQNLGHRRRATENLQSLRETIASIKLQLAQPGLLAADRLRLEEELTIKSARQAQLIARIQNWSTKIAQIQAQIDALMRNPERFRRP